jgi:hypothetical protein
VSSVTASRKFPWSAFRGPLSLIAAYVIGFNVVHHVGKSQWWFPFLVAAGALITMLFEDIYDEDLPGRWFGPMDMSNITCMFLGLGIPAVAFVCGIFRGGWHWWAASLIVLVVNAIIYFGFRQRGLSGLVVVVCLLGLAAL